jgi:hypothetical protein
LGSSKVSLESAILEKDTLLYGIGLAYVILIFDTNKNLLQAWSS